jgi:hypothetical protein
MTLFGFGGVALVAIGLPIQVDWSRYLCKKRSKKMALQKG